MQAPKSTGASALGIKKTFSAKLISQPKPIDLMERTFGSAISTIEKQEKPKESETKAPEATPSE